MVERPSFKVRPSPKTARTDMKDLFWVYLSPANMLLHGLQPGDACEFATSQGIPCPAIVRDNATIGDSVVQISKTFRGLYQLKPGDEIKFQTSKISIADVQEIVLRETSQEEGQEPIAEKDRIYWAWYMKDALQRAGYLCPGLPFDGIEFQQQKRSFQIFQINGSSGLNVYRFQLRLNPTTRIEALEETDDASVLRRGEPLQLLGHDIAGLDYQIAQINDMIAPFNTTYTHPKFPVGYPELRGGIIVHGPSRTGKSLILKKLGKLGWRKVFHLENLHERSRKDRMQAVHQVFMEARQNQPSLIVIPQLETVAGKDSQDHPPAFSIAEHLVQELDALGDAQVLVVAETNSSSNVNDNLREPGRLSLEVETTVPDSQARREILRLICGSSKDAKSTIFDKIGDRTHGYNGWDLRRLFECAMRQALKRVATSPSEPGTELDVTEEDFNAALLQVRPSSMREMFLETPKVRWSEIGGQQHVKKILRKAIEWPLKYPQIMKRRGLQPKKGLLLYGPPGCSKTLVAKAIATESDLNFIAVKGAELLSMYVGESERAVREVFRKARSASPSIVFFDEIDAIGKSRDDGNAGVNVVTTLLNELDGIEDRKEVFVLAATNNPGALDPALIRPGRITTLVYVGLPDFEARAEILQLRLRPIETDLSIDINELAHATEGYSGAEIVEICEEANFTAMEKEVETGLQDSITLDLVMEVIRNTEKGVTSDQLRQYHDWRSSNKK